MNRILVPTTRLSGAWPEIRLIAAIRWLLATAALTIIYLDPKEPDNQTWGATYAVLAAYVIYSSVLYFLAIRHTLAQSRFDYWSHWIDVAWCTVLSGMSSGTNRIFFFGFLFAILVASFRRGFKAGISVVIISAIAITAIGYTTETASPGFEGYGFDVYRFLLRPVFLVLLGYLMAHWGESEIESKRRLNLLKDLTLANPRLGADRTIASLIDKLRDFFAADLGLVLTRDSRTDEVTLYRSQSSTPSAFTQPEKVPEPLKQELLGLPNDLAVIYHRRRWNLAGSNHKLESFTLSDEQSAGSDHQSACEELARSFQAQSFLSVPLIRRQEIFGRLYFARSQGPAFKRKDIDFLLTVIAQTNPIVENIRLVDTLASDAAEQERQRIARDIHDSIIQPYIGFQFALSGLRRRINDGQVDLSRELDQLTQMTSIGVSDLRGYVARLKTRDARETTLAAALERFGRRFAEATGINVRVHFPHSLPLNDSLAAEVFQMVSEGLSNIRKHTEATQALVRIELDAGELRLHIENDGTLMNDAFEPKSISERAVSLNGSAVVSKTAERTVVDITIPL